MDSAHLLKTRQPCHKSMAKAPIRMSSDTHISSIALGVKPGWAQPCFCVETQQKQRDSRVPSYNTWLSFTLAELFVTGCYFASSVIPPACIRTVIIIRIGTREDLNCLRMIKPNANIPYVRGNFFPSVPPCGLPFVALVEDGSQRVAGDCFVVLCQRGLVLKWKRFSM